MYKKLIIGITAIIVVSIVYYGFSPLFRNTRIDEVSPVSKENVLTSPATKKSMMKDGVSTESLKMEESKPGISTAPVKGTTGHPGSGTVRIINAESGQVIRYENFKTLNGPDLFIYLAKDLDAKEFISLGELKATEGNVNYDVPASVDVGDYKYVMVWCKQFGILFNYADLSTLRTEAGN